MWLDRTKSRVDGRRKRTANIVTLMRIENSALRGSRRDDKSGRKMWGEARLNKYLKN